MPITAPKNREISGMPASIGTRLARSVTELPPLGGRMIASPTGDGGFARRSRSPSSFIQYGRPSYLWSTLRPSGRILDQLPTTAMTGKLEWLTRKRRIDPRLDAGGRRLPATVGP
jgi:hypothetical protein